MFTKLNEINLFIASNPEKIIAFQQMVETLSKEGNLSRSAVNELGIEAIKNWEKQKGKKLEELLNTEPEQRSHEINKIVGNFEFCMKQNLWTQPKIDKNLQIIRKTFEKIFEIQA